MLLYIVVALVKLFVFHSCTIDVFLRYVRIKKFIIINVIIILREIQNKDKFTIQYSSFTPSMLIDTMPIWGNPDVLVQSESI